ncbi:RHS repeat domain-containing protein [Parvicella tangerina]|uniref:RHS repeat protein n=1 Tax=Parvicella tangerina TaxID=2829795 RepID=A0A916JMD6_9FLAO|nr:RHS repeat domain-containing protein [Parvicella tangerina]CAG5081496.1 hypothetical protein CRYO30217_01647 [Parvicella tangerina]
MKYRVLLYLLLILNVGFSQKENSKYSVFHIISNDNPNFGPDEQRHNWEPPVINVVHSTRIDTTYNDTLILDYDNSGNVISYKRIGKWGRCHVLKYEYNENSQLVKEISLDCNGVVSRSLYIDYSDTTIIESEDGKNPSKVIYFLDSNHNRTKRQDIINGRNSTYWLKEYDKKGNVIDFKFYWSDTSFFHEVYEYGQNGELMESEILRFAHALPATPYDFLGRQIISLTNGNKRIYQYDDQNHQITEYRVQYNNDTIVYRYTYDQYGNLKEVLKNEEGTTKVDTYHEYKYDEYGNVTECKSYYKGELRSVSKTQYDYKK